MPEERTGSLGLIPGDQKFDVVHARHGKPVLQNLPENISKQFEFDRVKKFI